MKRVDITIVILSILLSVLSCRVYAADGFSPMADIHLHFNWNQEEVISASEVIAHLKAHNVVLAIVTSTPSDNAIKLRQQGGDWIFPYYSPYITPLKRDTWFVDDDVLIKTRAALESGNYYGLGELHLISGFGPRRDNKIFLGILSMAREFNVPVLIHTDASSEKYFEPICKQNHDIRFLWAHAGGTLEPDEVRALMEACSNVWVEFSALDPWHYDGLVDENGNLYTEWLELIKTFPDRFMTGTDPVWNAHQIFRWYEADEGWDRYSMLNQFHREWMKQLPADIEKKVRLTNARKFLYPDGMNKNAQ